MSTQFLMPDGAAPCPPDDHLGAQDLAAFVDGTVSGERRRQAVQHLAACAMCRVEVAEVRSLVDAAPARASAGAPARGGWVLPALGAVAATLVLVLLPRERPRGGEPPPVSQRTTPDAPVALDDDAPVVRLAAPAADATVERSIHFAWRSVAPDATYAVSIQDSSGTVVGNISTRDTTVVVPPEMQLTTGATYFWSVESQMADGRGARSAVRRFTVR